METSFKNKLSSRGLYLISKWCQHTCRITVKGKEIYQAIQESGSSLLWSSWHGNSHMLTRYFQEHQAGTKVMIMIPDDWHGEVLFPWLELVGFTPRPMNLESKGVGTARKFAKLIRDLKEGGVNNFIAPDGPSGPAYQVKPGLGFLAQKTGLPIIPVGCYNRNGYPVPRWDSYQIPYPFSRIQITFGEPLYFGRKEEMAVVNEKIRRALNDVAIQAKGDYYAEANSH